MPRLIDADALLETIEDHCTALSCCLTVEQWRGKTDMKRQVIEDIHNAPTIRFAENMNVHNNGWISVKDRLPEKYIDVLVLVQYPKVNGYTGHYVVIAWKSTDDDSWDSDNNNFNNDPEGVVTHWMPLPELPME